MGREDKGRREYGGKKEEKRKGQERKKQTKSTLNQTIPLKQSFVLFVCLCLFIVCLLFIVVVFVVLLLLCCLFGFCWLFVHALLSGISLLHHCARILDYVHIFPADIVLNTHMDPLSYFSFQPVLHDWCNKGRDMCYPVCGMAHIKEPLLLIDKSSLCGGSGFPFSL